MPVKGGRHDRRHAQPAEPDARATRACCTRTTSSNLLPHLAPEGGLELDFDDEIIAGGCVTHDGRIVNDRVREAIEGSPARAHEPDQRDHDLRAGRVRRLRGDLEGADDAAHAADVGHERDPRHRAARRPAGGGRGGRGHAGEGRRHGRGHLRHDQHRRWIPRHRPHARDVQGKGERKPQQTE